MKWLPQGPMLPSTYSINNRLVGRLEKAPDGAIAFHYDQSWLDWAPHFPISLSLPPRKAAYRGEPVVAVFDNLLPDNPNVRRLVAERTGAHGMDSHTAYWNRSARRDCVGAMQSSCRRWRYGGSIPAH